MSENKDLELIRLGRVVNGEGGLDISGLTAEEKDRCRKITSSIVDRDSLYSYGSELANARNEASEKLLDMNKIDRADEVGKYVLEVVEAIKESEYEEETGVKGLLYKILPKRFLKSYTEAKLKKFSSSKKVVDQIVHALEIQRIDLKSDFNTLEVMIEKTKDYVEQLGVLYVALNVKKEDLQNSLEDKVQKNKEIPGSHSIQELAEDREFLEDVDRHAYELLIAGQYSQNILIPSMMKMRQNNSELAKNAEQISKVVIPTWEMTVSMAIINNRTKRAADIQKTIKDEHNKMVIANSEMLKNVTMEIEKESKRGAIDIETYKKAYSNVIEALKESAEAAKIASEKRAADIKELNDINRENAAEMSKVVESFQKYYTAPKFYSDDSSAVKTKELK